MRYFLDCSTLFIRGKFRATGTRFPGQVVSVPTLLVHEIQNGTDRHAAENDPVVIATRAGFGPDQVSLATTRPLTDLIVLQYDFLTVFVLPPGPPRAVGLGAGEADIVICSSRGLSDAALQEASGVAVVAAGEALMDQGRIAVPSALCAVIVATEGGPEHASAGPGSAVGRGIRAAVMHGIAEAVRRTTGAAPRDRPSFFIFSRFRGDHWVEWIPEGCPYYPCHFEGQRCDFCYCPLYPCGDESLGEWSVSSNGGKVWNCARCTMIHDPAVTDHLKRYPEASKAELIRVWKGREKSGT